MGDALVTTVLVLDGEQRAALAVVRSLGRSGFTVVVGAQRSRSLAGASRFATKRVVISDPQRAPQAFLAGLQHALNTHNPSVLIPITERSLLSVLQNRSVLPGTIVPFSSIEVFNRSRDKATVLREAAALGLSIPGQVVIAHWDDLARVSVDQMPYPLVVKPSHSVGLDSTSTFSAAPRYVERRADLRRIVSAFPPEAYPLLLQERVVGPGIGVFLLRWDGRVLARFAHRRLREKPPAGGRSVYSESIEAPSELLRQAEVLLARLGWNGVAMVEFKRDLASGRHYLMEVNPRFWGSLQLAIDAGVDFPALLVRSSLGESVTPVDQYELGVRCRWWWGNVDYVLTRMLHSDRALSIAPDAPPRWKAIRDALRSRTGDRNEVWRADDPNPFIWETLNWLLRR